MNDRELPNNLAAAPDIESIEIIELVGKGGMSLVYKARQKQLDRIVAVKVLSKLAVQGGDGIKRFQKEAKLTSTLDHPNIVKTFSSGVSKDGQPYLVMEYLAGLSLKEELKQHGRLKLQKFKDVFLSALSALSQAHETGLVHRDIKPANIIICKGESGSETVKLVDFGIVKVLGELTTETQNLTNTGAVLGSPAYMSPEQCQSKPLDGRSDLYSIACVMYETLSGEPPFSGDSLLDVMHKHTAEPPPTVCDLSRKIEINKELAEVTLWGLAKDPAKRPQTASEFARRLNEVLEGIPLDQAPGLKKSAATSAKTRALRRLAIAFVLLCMVIILVAVVMRKHLQIQARVNTDTSRTPNSEDPAEREYNAALARTEKRYGSGHPQVAEKLDKLAGLYIQQSNWVQAELLLNRAKEIDEKALGKNHQRVAASLDGLANCYIHQNKWAEAEVLLKRSIAIKEKVVSQNVLAATLVLLEECFLHQRKYAEAEGLSQRILAISEKELGQDSLDVARSLGVLADCYQQQGRFANAVPLWKRSLTIHEQVIGPDNMDVVGILDRLGNCYQQQGKWAEAEPIFKHSLAVREELLGHDDKAVAAFLVDLAICCEHQGKYAVAESLLERSLAIREKVFGPIHPDVAASLNELANCYEHLGKDSKAKLLLKRANAIQSKPTRRSDQSSRTYGEPKLSEC